MPTPFPSSDDSEESGYQNFVDEGVAGLGRSSSSPSPLDAYIHVRDPSIDTNERRRRPHKKERDRRHSGVHHGLARLLAEEDVSAKKTLRYLHAALQRVDSETLRAQEAERRVLELAERFRTVNEARIAGQLELNRAKEELSLYKVQYDNARRELDRGRDILQDMESQRDEAEAAAARARSTARRLKEEQLVILAREEGRKQGYREGLKRGYEEGRSTGYNNEQQDTGQAPEEGMEPNEAGTFADEEAPQGMRTDPLEDLPVLNFSSPSPTNAPLGPSVSRQGANNAHSDAQGGGQGSRFREQGMSPAPSNASLNPLPGPSWPNTSTSERPKYIRPTYSAQPEARHPDTHVPPEGWIPAADQNQFIPIPPPHEFTRPPASPHSPALPLPAMPDVTVRSAHIPSGPPLKQRGSPRSLAESLPSSHPSTTISQFDLVSSPTMNGRSRKSGLSVIHEVSSTMEYSPGADSRAMPEAVVFPVTSPEQATDWGTTAGGSWDRGSPRSRTTSQRLADELRYSDPSVVDEWRRSAADEVRQQTDRNNAMPTFGSQMQQKSSKPGPLRRPAHVTTPSPLGGRPHSPADIRPASLTAGGGHRRSKSLLSGVSDVRSPGQAEQGPRSTRSSSYGDISIRIEPPSAPESNHLSPVSVVQHDMLSPNSAPQPLPAITQPQPEPVIPTVPNTPTMSPLPSMGMLSSMPAVGGLPPGFMPLGPPRPAAQSSPRQSSRDLYSNSNTAPTVPIYQNSSSSSSLGLGANSLPKNKHFRNRSVSHAASSSSDSLPSRPSTMRPPSAQGHAPVPNQRSVTPGRPQYASAPTPPGFKYPEPPSVVKQAFSNPPRGPVDPNVPPLGNMSPRSASSRLSGHQRSLSMNAGMTPGAVNRPLSNPSAPKLRRVPSNVSGDSVGSGKSYTHYDPSAYVDPAFLASSEDLSLNVQSPHTRANTRANAGQPVVPPGRRGSPNMKYSSRAGL